MDLLGDTTTLKDTSGILDVLLDSTKGISSLLEEADTTFNDTGYDAEDWEE
jgi:hypothetical protein